ncbi:cell division control 14, SIN component [Saitoella complicata NRRL Y-17804]|uniref:Cell division control protein 14 n=1 Tax=Saitoella complicata (strain BCRC 22490 / CBS 7301 / JCM 7358 / NBRC 10748 / NRRL Y-17804) TaxID=698492 RepID=A0A0E9NCA4_SAICN|nr:cell division control 14, SIN component [Saitoella complicata NRRL Y-17804]ODQ52692.1 cell division control 14, SIN component [Saitoella complicata NRRL Y-17804]GAO47459.1 hypothetical protein G7K_1666-t1 [Saitoella complicata NRRL Y-17804]
MEGLLSSAFDRLSSYDPAHIHGGLKQLDTLLAKLCLGPGKEGAIPTSFSDPAIRAFLTLQDSFQYNAASILLQTTNHLLSQPQNPHTSLLLLFTLSTLQGLLLLHPPSRHLFSRESSMNTLLDLLELEVSLEDGGGDVSEGRLECAVVQTLVCVMVDEWDNVRLFERLGGLATITGLFRRGTTPHVVKLKILEFLYFYLIDETSPRLRSVGAGSVDSGKSGDLWTCTGSRHGKEGGRWGGEGLGVRRTTEEKEAMLGEYLQNVDGLVRDLRELKPFGDL